jgi:hypothetical protein
MTPKSDKYHSIFFAIEYKNKFEKLIKAINESDLSTKYNFKQNLPDFIQFGIRSLKLNNNQVEGQLYTSINKISFESVDGNNIDNESIKEAEEIIKIANNLYLSSIDSSPEKKFVGCIIRKGFKLEESEISEIKSIYLDESNNKKIELKFNFHDSDGLNHNIFFDYLFDKNYLLTTYDINTTYVEDKDKYKLNDIISKIKDVIDDPLRVYKFLVKSNE